MPSSASEKRRTHWSLTRAVTFVVLIIWFVFSILAPWYAKELNEFTFLGFKLGYYMVVQGSLIVFVVLIIVHNLIQDGIDAAYGQGD